MGLISYTDLQDGTSADAADVNGLAAVVLGEINGNLDADNFKDSAVETAKIADSAVTNDKVADATLTGDKMVNHTVTALQMEEFMASTASAATITPSKRVYIVTALASGTTIAVPNFTPSDGMTLIIRIKDNGTPRSLSFNSGYRAIGVTLPTTTTTSKELYIGAVYNTASSKWDVVSIARES